MGERVKSLTWTFVHKIEFFFHLGNLSQEWYLCHVDSVSVTGISIWSDIRKPSSMKSMLADNRKHFQWQVCINNDKIYLPSCSSCDRKFVHFSYHRKLVYFSYHSFMWGLKISCHQGCQDAFKNSILLSNL